MNLIPSYIDTHRKSITFNNDEATFFLGCLGTYTKVIEILKLTLDDLIFLVLVFHALNPAKVHPICSLLACVMNLLVSLKAHCLMHWENRI